MVVISLRVKVLKYSLKVNKFELPPFKEIECLRYTNENEVELSSLYIPAVARVEVGNMILQMAKKISIGTVLSLMREGDVLSRGIK